jgi:hypothetical protein
MKLGMLCEETLRGYVMEKNFIFKKVNYTNEAVEMSIENHQIINKLKKKLFKCYCLDMNIIIMDVERKILDCNLILKKIPLRTLDMYGQI